MKNTLLITLAFLTIIGLYWSTDAIGWLFDHQRLRRFTPNSTAVQLAFDLVGIITCILFLLCVTYKKYWSRATFSKKSNIAGFTLIWVGVVYSVAMTYSFLRQIDKLYDYYKADYNIKGRVFEAHPELGHHGIPNGSGSHNYVIGTTQKQIPILLDSLGFRTVGPQLRLKSDTTLLFLGCSFTWGDFCPAEKTYSYHVAKELGGQYLNAGTSAYGLAQMLILARKAIPKSKPKIVFLQHSPWLADRARFTFYPTAYGVMPFPFIHRKDDGHDVHPPLFMSSLYKPESIYFKQTARSFFDKCVFVWKVGLPVVVLDFFKHKWSILQINLGLKPRAESDNQAIERYVYNEIAKICQSNQSQLVVVNLGGFGYDETRFTNHYDRTHFNKTTNAQNITFVDVDSALRTAIKTPKEYDKYLLWDKNGRDSILFDIHPNANTHRLIADQILQKLNKMP